MDTTEFNANYENYLHEIREVVRYELRPAIHDLSLLLPGELMPPETGFHNEDEARGFVWHLFIDRVNERMSKPLTIDIEDIKSINDIETFFILLIKERVLYHPEMSFHGFINRDIYGNNTGPVFSKEEADRLDRLMKKCQNLADDMGVNIFDISKRADFIVRGKNSWNQSTSED